MLLPKSGQAGETFSAQCGMRRGWKQGAQPGCKKP